MAGQDLCSLFVPQFAAQMLAEDRNMCVITSLLHLTQLAMTTHMSDWQHGTHCQTVVIFDVRAL